MGDIESEILTSATQRLSEKNRKIELLQAEVERLKEQVQSWSDGHSVQEHRHRAEVKRLTQQLADRDEENSQQRGIANVLAESLAWYNGTTMPQCLKWARNLERNSEERKSREARALQANGGQDDE